MKQWWIICLCVGSFVSCSKNEGPETKADPDIAVADDTQLSNDTDAPSDLNGVENELPNPEDSSEGSDAQNTGEGLNPGTDTKPAEEDGNGPPPECTTANQADICKDFNNCTQDLCVAGQCENPAIVGCCKLDKECDDGVPCTVDECNSVKGECIHSLEDNNCCLSTDDCFDGDPCTDEICIANTCVRPQSADCPCVLNSLCNDNNPCTEDQCVKKICSYSLKDAANCCAKSDDCDDGDSDNYDGCQQGLCWHTSLNCGQNSDCVSTDPCVTASCSNGQCSFEEQDGCCNANADCGDGVTGTEDLCMNGECVYLIAAPKLCTKDADCTSQNSCLSGSCAGKAMVCSYAATGAAGCCQSDVDCGDGGPCTILSCEDFQCKSSPSTAKTVLWETNFDNGTLQGWTTEGDGKAAKWQPSNGDSKSPNYSLYYGQLPQMNTDVGVTKGYVTSDLIELPLVSKVYLSFWRNAKINPGLSLDKLELHALVAGQSIPLWDKSYQNGPGIGWKHVEIELTDKINASFKLRFSFDSLFTTTAVKEGVYIDDIKILKGCP